MVKLLRDVIGVIGGVTAIDPNFDLTKTKPASV